VSLTGASSTIDISKIFLVRGGILRALLINCGTGVLQLSGGCGQQGRRHRLEPGPSSGCRSFDGFGGWNIELWMRVGEVREDGFAG
jgi:hypothetical protein